MARLGDSITYGNHSVTGDLTVSGTQIVPVNLTGGANVNVAGSYPNFTISATDTDTNTTYSAGTGITLAGTTFSLTGDSFSSVGTYAGLRAQATTKADVGLSLIPNATVTSADTVNAIMRRDGSGDVFCRLFRSTYAVTNATIAGIYTTRTVGGDYMRPSTPAQVKTALSIAAGDVSGLTDAATTTVATIRAGTTAANVGLGSVRNVSSYSQSEANANFLGTTAKAADSNLLDGFNSSTSSTANTVAVRNSSGDINARLFRSEYDTTNSTINYIMTQVDTASNNYIRPSTPAQFRASVTDSQYLGLGGGILTGRLTLNEGAPTIHFKDTDNNNAFIHVNSGLLYILAAEAANATTWDGGPHPMVLDLTSGSVTFAGNVTAFSDERLKSDLQLIPDALEKVRSLSGFTFNRQDSNKRETGLIAQEVLKVLPEAVHGGPTEADPDGHYSVAYGNMVGLLIESIKEQQAQMEVMKTEIQELKRK